MFMHIFSLVTILPLMIKMLTIPQLLKILTPGRAKLKGDRNLRQLREIIIKYTNYVLSLDFWIYRDICLTRSLVLYYFLRKYGLDVQICFGVKHKKDSEGRDAGRKLQGHAWLSLNGYFFLENNPEDTRTFAVTYSFPSTPHV